MKDILARARALYANGSNDNIEIDDDAPISRSDDAGGLWVQAWVWVPDEQPGESAP